MGIEMKFRTIREGGESLGLCWCHEIQKMGELREKPGNHFVFHNIHSTVAWIQTPDQRSGNTLIQFSEKLKLIFFPQQSITLTMNNKLQLRDQIGVRLLDIDGNHVNQQENQGSIEENVLTMDLVSERIGRYHLKLETWVRVPVQASMLIHLLLQVPTQLRCLLAGPWTSGREFVFILNVYPINCRLHIFRF